ncbi:MAG TPA: hypothetical protein VGD60_07230 [Candidatus Acidoferrales bacterium]
MKKLTNDEDYLSVVLLLAFFIPQTSGSQEVGTHKRDSMLLSPVLLLPGYRSHLGAGVEGATVARIWKEGGLTMGASVGCCYAAEAITMEKDRILWREQQEINGKHVTMVYTKQQELVVSFTDDRGSYPANFKATVRGEHDLTEMLLMVLTFDGTNRFPAEAAPATISRPPASN